MTICELHIALHEAVDRLVWKQPEKEQLQNEVTQIVEQFAATQAQLSQGRPLSDLRQGGGLGV